MGVFSGVALTVRQVVQQLESLAKIARKAVQLFTRLQGRAGSHRGHLHRRAEQRAGFEMIGELNSVGAARLAAFGQIAKLSLHQPLNANGVGKLRHSLGFRLTADAVCHRDNAEGVAQQGDGGQNRHRLAKLAMDSRAAAPQFSVVHAGNIVEDQRGGMHHLYGAGEVEQAAEFVAVAQVMSGQHQQHRPDAFARRQCPFAHREPHAVAFAFYRQQSIEALFDIRE